MEGTISSEIYHKILADKPYCVTNSNGVLFFDGISFSDFVDLDILKYMDGEIVEAGNQYFSIESPDLATELIYYLNLVNSNPIDPCIIQIDDRSKLSFLLEETKSHNKIKYDPLDTKILGYLQELVPGFSLQKEYTKWQRIFTSKPIDLLKKYKDRIIKLIYDENTQHLSMVMSESISEMEDDETHRGDYALNNITKNQFIDTCLYLWNERYIYNLKAVGSKVKIPRVNL